MEIAFIKNEHTLVIFYNSADENQKKLIDRLLKIQKEDSYAEWFTVVHDIQKLRGKMLYELQHKGENLPIAYFSKWVSGDRVDFDLGQVNK